MIIILWLFCCCHALPVFSCHKGTNSIYGNWKGGVGSLTCSMITACAIRTKVRQALLSLRKRWHRIEKLSFNLELNYWLHIMHYIYSSLANQLPPRIRSSNRCVRRVTTPHCKWKSKKTTCSLMWTQWQRNRCGQKVTVIQTKKRLLFLTPPKTVGAITTWWSGASHYYSISITMGRCYIVHMQL